MSISSVTNKWVSPGDGLVTAFPVPGLFYSNAHIVVYLVDTTTGVETLQTQGTHYSVTGAGVATGGTVTFVTAPPVGCQVVRRRIVPYTQLIDLKEADKLPPDTVEQSLDLYHV